MAMNPYILFTTSLPEAILSLAIILLVAGGKDRLKVSKSNIFHFVTALSLMLTASWFICPIAPNSFVNMILHTLAYVLIVVIVYRLNVIYGWFGVSFAMTVMVTAELIYTPFVINYIFKGMEDLSNAYRWYPLLSLPCRIIQFLVAGFLWKHDILLVTRINRRFHSFFIATFLTLMLVETLFYFIFNAYQDKMSVVYQIAYSLAMFAMVVVLNLLIFRLIYVAIGGIVVKGYEKYTELEENAKFAFGEIEALLEQNKVNEAIRLIGELKG